MCVNFIYLFTFYDFSFKFINNLSSWYCKRIVKKNQAKLEKMRKEKKAILDQVMEKETYNKAKEILEKFSKEVTPNPILKVICYFL